MSQLRDDLLAITNDDMSPIDTGLLLALVEMANEEGVSAELLEYVAEFMLERMYEASVNVQVCSSAQSLLSLCLLSAHRLLSLCSLLTAHCSLPLTFSAPSRAGQVARRAAGKSTSTAFCLWFLDPL